MPEARLRPQDRLSPRFAPWRFMLAVDEVNYDLGESVALARRDGTLRVINLASGVNFIPPPRRLVNFVIKSASDPVFWHDYDGPQGHLAGRAAVAACESLQAPRALPLHIDNVIVTSGASAALSLVAHGLAAAAGPGDCDVPPRATLPVPTFPLAGACLAQAGFDIDQVASGTSGRWLPSVPELTRASGPHTRVVYVNTFNNPSGEHYSEADFRQLVEWAKDHRVTILHDMVSSDVVRVGTLPHLLSIAAAAEYLDGVITVGSMSKTRAIPGFRVGWLIASAPFVREISRLNEMLAPSSPAIAAPALVMDRLCTAAVSLAGAAAGELPQLADAWCALRAQIDPYLPAMPELDEFLGSLAAELSGGAAAELIRWRAALREILARNVAALAEHFNDLAADVPPWRGDFNTFVRVPGLDGRDYLATTHRLFREYGLQTLPAPVFGHDDSWWSRRGYFTRLSFALPPDVWLDGLHRLRAAVRCE
jgi:aspartate/methionine/tyrosine aminotransferase